MTRLTKVFLMAPNTAFSKNTPVVVIVKRIVSTANTNRQQISVFVGECLQVNFELPSRGLVLACCYQHRLLVNCGIIWTKQKDHILNPSINTDEEDVLKKLLIQCVSV